MLPGKKYTPEEILRIIVRRKWLILLPFVTGALAGVVGYLKYPEEYRSETLIMVIPQRIPDSYVKSTITATVEDRLASISDQILSRSRLERIILDFDLYKEARAAGVMEDVVQQMRNNIKPTLIARESAFRISYVSRDPQIAQKVTERLASLYIEENLRERKTLSAGTSQFLESQLEDAKRRLVDHERKLEEYRRIHAGQLPSQLQSNLQAIQNAQLQLQSLSESLNRSRERRLLLERQLGDAQTVTTPVFATPETTTVPDGSLTTPQQLEAAQARLDLYRLRFTADHPDVKTLVRTIAELQAKVDEESRKAPGAAVSSKPLSPTETARQKRARDLRADIDILDRQMVSSQAEEARLKSLIASYQTKVELLPTRESELVELTRDYATLQETYSSLLKKREDSKLSANLELRQIGEQFKILDPASVPQRPSNERQRLFVLTGGAIGGLVLGLGLVGFLEYRDSSFKCEEDVQRVLTLPVLALVPIMVSTTDRERAERSRKRRFTFGLAAVAVFVASAAAFFWRLQS